MHSSHPPTADYAHRHGEGRLLEARGCKRHRALRATCKESLYRRTHTSQNALRHPTLCLLLFYSTARSPPRDCQSHKQSRADLLAPKQRTATDTLRGGASAPNPPGREAVLPLASVRLAPPLPNHPSQSTDPPPVGSDPISFRYICINLLCSLLSGF